MDIKDTHSELGQGELVDQWDAEDGGARAAMLARQGFLPELTPALPGVTAPLPQDPFGNEGGPAPPPPWVTRLRNCNVRADFQNFLNALYAFHQQFRKPKYASTFSVMRYPMHAFLQSILSPKPPQDVLISTFSGSMQAQIQLLILKKTGRANTAAFYRHVNAVCISLTTFINTCQAGIRQFRELEEKGITHFPPDAVTPGSPTRVHQSLVHMESVAELVRKIDTLDSPGVDPSCTQVLKSSFHYYPTAMIIATICIGFAVGAGLQSILLTYADLDKVQSSTGVDVRLVLPLVMVAIATLISVIVVVKRIRWMKLDYSARKEAEATEARRERLASQRRVNKQARSRRLISSASDSADEFQRERATSAPIEFDDHSRRGPYKSLPQHQQQHQRSALVSQQQASYSSFGGNSNNMPPAANRGGAATPTSATSHVTSYGHTYQSGGSGGSVVAVTTPFDAAAGLPTTRPIAATIVIDHVPNQIHIPTQTVVASSSNSSLAASSSTGVTDEVNPFLPPNTKPIAVAHQQSSGDDNNDDDNGMAQSSSFVLPPYESGVMSSSPIFSAPPPLPGDFDDSKRIGKKKKKSKHQSNKDVNPFE